MGLPLISQRLNALTVKSWVILLGSVDLLNTRKTEQMVVMKSGFGLIEIQHSKALVHFGLRWNLRDFDWSNKADDTSVSLALMAYKLRGFGVESSNGMESENSSGNTNSTESLYPNFQKAKGFHSVPPPTDPCISFHITFAMSTQQDIYADGSENRPPMLNKENYVPWSSRLLRYAKSRPNGKLIYNSIINGPYVRRMIPEPGDQNREVFVNETFHEQTDDELTEKELKQVKANDQAIQTILLGLPEDIYAAVDSCETAQEIWLRVQQMMKGSDIGIQEKKAKLFNEWERFTSTDGESIESYYHRFSKLMNDFKRNKHFPEKIASNLKFLNNLQPEWSRHVTIVHQTKDLHTTDYTQLYDFLKYNQKEVDDLRAE
ncbi:hypothetical protein Tco_0864244 [Tanacetum coccineum]